MAGSQMCESVMGGRPGHVGLPSAAFNESRNLSHAQTTEAAR